MDTAPLRHVDVELEVLEMVRSESRLYRRGHVLDTPEHRLDTERRILAVNHSQWPATLHDDGHHTAGRRSRIERPLPRPNRSG